MEIAPGSLVTTRTIEAALFDSPSTSSRIPLKFGFEGGEFGIVLEVLNNDGDDYYRVLTPRGVGWILCLWVEEAW